MSLRVGDWVENVKFGVGQITEDRSRDKYTVRFVEGSPEPRIILGGSLSRSYAPNGFAFPKVKGTGHRRKSQKAAAATPTA